MSELDTIIWSPSPVPAVFEHGDFAFVPRGSAHAFLEIERTNYTAVGRKIKTTLRLAEDLIRPKPRLDHPGSLGVVCLREHRRKDDALARLVDQRRAVILLERVGERLVARPDDVWLLVNFLAGVRGRAFKMEGLLQVAWPPGTLPVPR